MQLGQDPFIGYLSHDAQEIELYPQETLTFGVNTSQANVVLKADSQAYNELKMPIALESWWDPTRSASQV